MSEPFEVPPLRFLALSTASLQVFEANIMCKKIRDLGRLLRDYVTKIPIPKRLKDAMLESLTQAYREVTRWWDKHAEIFVAENKNRRAEHLKLYFDQIVWDHYKMTINDLKTAQSIIDHCDWETLKFQFACAYALEETLLKKFDSVHFYVFRKRLSDHPLYDFWFEFIEKGEGEMFASEGLQPHQLVSLVFQWALSNGFKELTEYLWQKVTPTQREYVGLIQFRKLGQSAKHADVYQFLCSQLCALNELGMSRMIWQTGNIDLIPMFQTKMLPSLSSECYILIRLYLYILQVFQPQLQKVLTDSNATIREMNFQRVRFVLDNCCPLMRGALLRAHKYRALQSALAHRDVRLFRFLTSHLTPQDLSEAYDILKTDDKIKSEDLLEAKRVLMKRQISMP